MICTLPKIDVESPEFIKQKWFGEQRTPVYVYKWEDLQVQHGIGDVHIDMSKAANIKENNTVVVHFCLINSGDSTSSSVATTFNGLNL